MNKRRDNMPTIKGGFSTKVKADMKKITDMVFRPLSPDSPKMTAPKEKEKVPVPVETKAPVSKPKEKAPVPIKTNTRPTTTPRVTSRKKSGKSKRRK